MSQIVKCHNCDRNIGRMEQAFLYRDEVVCGECHRRLAEGMGAGPAKAVKVVPSPEKRRKADVRSKLAECRACGRTVSADALRCPECGEPRPGSRLSWQWYIVMACAALFLFMNC
jgi:uncharacterized paraquat-inducible protein A